MDSRPGGHLTDAEIRDFVRGKLRGPAAAPLLDHLTSCPDCRRRTARLPGDAPVTKPQAAEPSPTPPGTFDRATVPPVNERKPSPEVPPELARLDDYEVVRELGRGGMGVVYLARNKLMDRLEVLKVMNRASVGRPEAVERFLQEIRSAARLIHPNVATAHSARQLGDFLVLAIQYVEGEDLERVVRTRGPLSIPRACYCAHQAAQGLQCAHDLGLVHRDIKPGNLLLSTQRKPPVVKIVDFGLAKAKAEVPAGPALTLTNQVMGTPGYIAPEQLHDARTADIRSDIYGLGCTLYFLLSGESPFQGNNPYALMLAQENGEVKPLREVRPDVPDALAAVVARMMARDPAGRFQQPDDVARALVPFIRGDKSPAEGSGPYRAVTPAAVDTASGLPLPTVMGGKRPEKKPAWARSLLGWRKSSANALARWRSIPKERQRRVALIVGGVLLFGVLVWGIVAWLTRQPAEPAGTAIATTDAPVISGEADDAAALRVFDCTGAEGSSAAKVHRFQEEWARRLNRKVEETVDIADGVTMTFVLVPPGKFLMGSPENEEGREADETLHPVVLSKPFYLGKYEVTQAQYDALSRPNPSAFNGSDRPVERVSPEDAERFAASLASKRSDGCLYRLPTEAEWEYGCRGGHPSTCPFGTGDGRSLSSADANFDGAYPYGTALAGPFLKETCRVGLYPANAFGLHDMEGNVWEWCADWYAPYPAGAVTDPPGPSTGTDRVLRGGSWYGSAGSCRAAARLKAAPGHRVNSLGFRLARTIPSAVP
jgi:serine/threonine protein kinase/formylglycine-generating enzyme required for sulfatase activity